MLKVFGKEQQRDTLRNIEGPEVQGLNSLCVTESQE